MLYFCHSPWITLYEKIETLMPLSTKWLPCDASYKMGNFQVCIHVNSVHTYFTNPRYIITSCNFCQYTNISVIVYYILVASYTSGSISYIVNYSTVAT